MWVLVPWPGIEPGPPALGAWSHSHWTTKEIPQYMLLLQGLGHAILEAHHLPSASWRSGQACGVVWRPANWRTGHVDSSSNLKAWESGHWGQKKTDGPAHIVRQREGDFSLLSCPLTPSVWDDTRPLTPSVWDVFLSSYILGVGWRLSSYILGVGCLPVLLHPRCGMTPILLHPWCGMSSCPLTPSVWDDARPLTPSGWDDACPLTPLVWDDAHPLTPSVWDDACPLTPLVWDDACLHQRTMSALLSPTWVQMLMSLEALPKIPPEITFNQISVLVKLTHEIHWHMQSPWNCLPGCEIGDTSQGPHTALCWT